MPKRIYLANAKRYAILDDSDYERRARFKWYMTAQGYVARTTSIPFTTRGRSRWPRTKKILMHREIMDFPKGMQVDHINGNKLDNRRENLRVATAAQNQFNRCTEKRNRSGYNGVTFDKSSRRWQARIGFKRKQYHLGYFDTPEEAARARDAVALKLHGDYCRLNFPGENIQPADLPTPKKSSVYRGVCFNKRDDRWWATFTINRRSIHLGRFTSEVEAAEAYDRAAVAYRDDAARLNFPIEP